MKLSTVVISSVASQAALNRNPNGKEDIVYTPLQAEIFELNGLGSIPEILINRDSNEADELTPKTLEKQFGSNFRAELDRQKENIKKNGKGFINGVTIDGAFGGQWRIIRDINGIWHVPMFFGEGEVWADKSRNIPFWGDQANVVMSGKDMIKKIQQEFERASCLTVDVFDDEAAVLSYFDSLDSDAMYDTANGAFIHPSFASTGTLSRLKAINGSGCWSYVGKVFGTNQEISFVDEWCAGGVEPGLHEMMHALGFHHEQSRYDRDSKIWIDENVCGNAGLFSALLYKAPRSAWPDMLNQWGREHDYTSIMHYESWVCSASGTGHTVDGSTNSADGKDWKRYGFLTNTGEYLPTESSLDKRFEMSDIAQINEIYNCNDRSNDHHFKTFMLYCDNNPELAYPVGWRCDGSCDCSDDSSDCSDESNCNIVQKSGTGGTLGGGVGSLATGDWINLDQLKAMSVGVRTDRDGTVGYPCSKYGYRIVDDGSGIKCECAPWAGNGSQWGAVVDLTIEGNNCDSVNPDQCTNECSSVTGANCSLDNTKFNGVDCCTDTATEYNIVNGACVERNRCEDGTHSCMSEAYGGVCTWTTDVGYTCGCRRGYNGQGCSYRAFQENEGGCDSTWEDILVGVQVSEFPYYSTCRTNVAVCSDTGSQGHDCVASASCTMIEERYSKGLVGGTYTCTCPTGETGDGKLSGTGCSGDVCFNDPTLCPTLDNLGNTISTCVANADGTHACICPDTHTGDASVDGSCILKIDECVEGTHDCGANQICIDQESLFTCDCFVNFETYGFSKTGSYENGDLVCTDVDECSTLTMPCAQRNSVCTNQVPSECDVSQDVGQCTSFLNFFDPAYGQNCPINAFCNTHTCACSAGFVSTDMIMFLDQGSVTFTGIDCDTPEEYNNCAVTGDGTGCVDPFCDNQCSDAPCVDTGALSYNSELDGYARGYICDCRSIDMYGDGIGGCTAAACPANSSSITRQIRFSILIASLLLWRTGPAHATKDSSFLKAILEIQRTPLAFPIPASHLRVIQRPQNAPAFPIQKLSAAVSPDSERSMARQMFAKISMNVLRELTTVLL
ncbi:unnamed protein product [Oikopleura dioica]|uniref:Metalloendopeptidase n=1 Tax=Oikopleura dioica TaxID=34765 RepID=E4XWM0_OIKDI|nr:unnamed protein product [Oikopleura dioica]